ncbi:MAG: SpoIIE family protein phosphatase [Acidobacteriota bacterium]
MLPNKILVGKTRWFWTVFLLLSPLAYLAGIWLTVKYDPNAHAVISVNRQQAITIASDFAASKGINVSGWNSLCHFKINNELFFYYRLEPNAEREKASVIAPAMTIGVLFRSSTGGENFEVEMTNAGQVLGFEHKLSQAGEEKDTGEPEAKRIAQEALQQRMSRLGVSYPIELQQTDDGNENQFSPRGRTGQTKGLRKYIWRWPITPPNEVKIESVLTVRGGKLTGDFVKAEVDGAFAHQRLNQRKLQKGIGIGVYTLLMIVFVIYGIYRFIQRARQKEVSYQRVFISVLLVAPVLAGFHVLSDMITYDPAKSGMNPIWVDWIILSTTVLSDIVVALFMGLAYGSGEGDIREAYPGKLTSIDALLTGKLFSRNVGRSVVFGCAIGGWIMLSFLLAPVLWRNVPGTGEPPNQVVDSLIGYAPWLSPFMAWPMDVILVTLIGLLVPLPLLLRRKWIGRAKMPLLFVCVWIACAPPFLVFRPWEASLLVGAARAALFLLAFFKFDLLTAMVALAYPAFVSFALMPAMQPNPSLSRAGYFSLTVAVILLAVEMFFAFKGRLFQDEEVRPVYARMLAERLSMQAEVSAAREAQQRLMPAELPKTKQFSIAACCLPAFEVGGDFYDVFKLEDGKVGVLIAEGGGRGLGSALSIAYAKGYLMPKILNSRQADDSPTELIRGLQDRLASLLEEDDSLSLAYAVFDANDGQLRYARTGTHPVVMVCKSHDASALLRLPDEREIRFASIHQDKVEQIKIVEGVTTLEEGDSVVLFTDGLDKDWQRNKTTPEKEFAKTIKAAAGKTGDDLQSALVKNINTHAKQARKQGVEDDLTAVIVRFEKMQSEVQLETQAAPQGETA